MQLDSAIDEAAKNQSDQNKSCICLVTRSASSVSVKVWKHLLYCDQYFHNRSQQVVPCILNDTKLDGFRECLHWDG